MSSLIKMMIVLVVASLACGRAPERAEQAQAPEESPPAETAAPADPVAARAHDLDTRLSTLQATEGNLELRGTATHYRAYWDKGAVAVLDEELSLADGTKKARYYYDESGHLIDYREESTQKDEMDPSAMVPIVLRMTFEPSGELRDGSKTAGGASQEIEDFEINAARERGRELLTLVTVATGR